MISNDHKIQSPKPLIKETSSNSSEFKIGALLIKSGKLTAEEARKVVELAKTNSLLFGDAAIRLGFVTEQDIQHVLAKQFSYTYVNDTDAISPDLVSAFYPKSTEAEFIRSLRTQLALGWFKDGNNKALAISSIDQESGSSRFAANLAVSFSQLGKRTLLIDANLRNPSQQNIFRLNPTRGLADILIGRGGLDTINTIKSIENLSVLSSGTVPPNPLELVGGKMFVELLNFLNEVFDIILIDTPAFNIGADAQTIAATVGGSFLIVRKDMTKAADLTKTVKLLTSTGASVVGSLMTDF